MQDIDTLRGCVIVELIAIWVLALLAFLYYRWWREEQTTTTSGSSDRLAELKASRERIGTLEKESRDLAYRLAEVEEDLNDANHYRQTNLNELTNVGKKLISEEAARLKAETDAAHWQKDAQNSTAELTEARRQRDVAQKERSEANAELSVCRKKLEEAQVDRGLLRVGMRELLERVAPEPTTPTADINQYLRAGQWIAEPKKND